MPSFVKNFVYPFGFCPVIVWLIDQRELISIVPDASPQGEQKIKKVTQNIGKMENNKGGKQDSGR